VTVEKINLFQQRDGITSDEEGMNGTTNGVAVSQQCRHWMYVRTNACKKLGSVLGWEHQLRC
jgi:hypothetical protein